MVFTPAVAFIPISAYLRTGHFFFWLFISPSVSRIRYNQWRFGDVDFLSTKCTDLWYSTTYWLQTKYSWLLFFIYLVWIVRFKDVLSKVSLKTSFRTNIFLVLLFFIFSLVFSCFLFFFLLLASYFSCYVLFYFGFVSSFSFSFPLSQLRSCSSFCRQV